MTFRRALSFSFLLLLVTIPALSQSKLWGTTSDGGNGTGLIFKVNPDGTGYEESFIFTGNPGGERIDINGLTIAPNGDIWGSTTLGGTDDHGVIFKIQSADLSFAVIKDFLQANTALHHPYGQLFFASDGKVYGYTSDGASGTIFRMSTTGANYETLKTFNGTTGSPVLGYGLIQANDNNLYGIVDGGTLAGGAIVKIQLNGTVTTLRDFDPNAVTANPVGNLIQGSDGNLYGVSKSRAHATDRSIFKLSLDGTTLTSIYSFTNAADGQDPVAGVVEGDGGYLFGVTKGGGSSSAGMLFRIKTDGSGFEHIFDFDAASGSAPEAPLVKGPDGYIYGVTNADGANAAGSVFTVLADGSDFHIITSLTKPDGYRTRSQFTVDANGDMYIPCVSGGLGKGVILNVSTDGTKVVTAYDFHQTSDPQYPNRNPIQISTGDVFGSTVGGGTFNRGTIYKLTASGTDFQKLFDFPGGEGGEAPADLIEGPGQFLYGATQRGGDVNFGIIFKIKIDGTGFQKLHDFTGADGNGMIAELRMASDGMLYGFCPNGGANNAGTLFKISTTGQNFQKLMDFSTFTTGANPAGSPIEAADGFLYGMTTSGGVSSAGTIFKIKKDGTGYLKLKDLTTVSGGLPLSRLILTATDELAGTLAMGGANSGGVLFKMKTDGSNFTPVREFSSAGFLQGGPVLGDDGFFYGTTAFGGTSGHGSVYKIKTDGTSFQQIADLGVAGRGIYPMGPMVFVSGGKQSQTITFQALTPKRIDDQPFGLVASASSGLPISFGSSDPNIATVEGNVVTIHGLGSTIITAFQNGNAGFFAANPVSYTLIVNKKGQTITFNAPGAKTFGDAPFAITATSSSGLTVSFASSNTSIATVTGNQVTILAAGSVDITASQDGDEIYDVATPVVRTLTINKIAQTISFADVAAKTIGDAPFDLTVSTSSGLAVTLSATPSDKVSMSGVRVTLAVAGRVTINANQSGNANYAAATTVAKSFCINPAKPQIIVTGLDTSTPVLSSTNATGNQWYFNGTAITGATAKNYTATANGLYTVKTTVDDCVSASADNYALVITGLEDAADVFQVYPNPATDKIYVESANSKAQAQFILVDAVGRIIENAQGREHTFDVSSLAKGIYIIRIVSEKNTAAHRVYVSH